MDSANKINKPLCVDCDGTLIATDLLCEAFFLLLKQYPIGLFFLPFWLVKGKVYLKERMAEHVVFDWSTLPFRPEVIEVINHARVEGRQTVLATTPVKRMFGLRGPSTLTHRKWHSCASVCSST